MCMCVVCGVCGVCTSTHVDAKMCPYLCAHRFLDGPVRVQAGVAQVAEVVDVAEELILQLWVLDDSHGAVLGRRQGGGGDMGGVVGWRKDPHTPGMLPSCCSEDEGKTRLCVRQSSQS